jgi:acetylornithine deacetylase/succinyl-diaminopimelate desuccinylase-like protein
MDSSHSTRWIGGSYVDAFEKYIEANKDRFISEIQELCRQPSISAQNVGMKETADLVRARLDKLGAKTRLLPVKDSYPVVYGEIGEGPRTLMIYDHYDVQPPEPLDLWESPPFAAEIRNGRLYARGVADNKGNLMSRIQAVEAWLATRGALPLKVKFVVEGEEEIGSPHLHLVAEANRALLAADGCLWESGYKDIDGHVTLTFGLKGICYVELEAHGANRDMHSAYATIVPNPAWRLVWALATLKSADDHILVDGLMDHVRQPMAKERAMLRRIPFDEERYKASYGLKAFNRNLTGYKLQKKHLFEPTCTICGMISGYTGPGSKTVLPAVASVKLDFRLVPNLTPEIVMDLLRKHLDKRGFSDIIIRSVDGEMPALSPVDGRLAKASIAAARKVYGEKPSVQPLTAGSGPMYPLCQAAGIPTTSGGCGDAQSYVHAPNESVALDSYFQAIRYVGELIRKFA